MTYHEPLMTSTRPRLVILKGSVPLESAQLQALRSVFEVIEVHSPAAAKKMLDGSVGGVVLCAPGEYLNIEGESLPTAASSILGRIGDGIGVVDANGSLLWTDARFKVHEDHVRNEFIRLCKLAIEAFNVPADQAGPTRRHNKRYNFASDHQHYELIVSPASLDQTLDRVTTVVGVLWDITTSKQLLERFEAIEAAGADLIRIDSAILTKMNLAERLKLLEQKIVKALRDVLGFENFEVRLLDRESGQLELVIAENIAPLKVGEVLYAGLESNGISGYVAATGRSYLCPDVQSDPIYREGLENAASTLTVPLMLDDRVIGTLNVESPRPNAFSDHDRRFAELFGRYIATAMNILDLLVVERFTTNEQVAANIVGELSIPIAELTRQVGAIRTAHPGDQNIQGVTDQLLQTIAKLNKRLQSCTTGPRTILGAEQELHRHQPDPLLIGKRILVADDEPAIRDTLNAILTQKGATVTVCRNGAETIEAIEKAAQTPGEFFDMVISDIKMPDRNGYEVYRTVKSLYAETPVVLMTGFGYDPHHSIVRASQEGLQSFLFKPFKVNQLMEVVSRSLMAKRA